MCIRDSDLGVSQRWANKFSEAGIETVADLLGRTEDDLLRIEGIGVKAIEELKMCIRDSYESARLDETPQVAEKRTVAGRIPAETVEKLKALRDQMQGS